MPKQTEKSRKIRRKRNLILRPVVPRTNEELESFIREANEVKALVQQTGWGIIARDLSEYQKGIASKLAYISPTSPEYDSLRILYIAVDKLFSIVEDYENNRNKAIELLNKLENPDVAIAMDVDNEGVEDNGL